MTTFLGYPVHTTRDVLEVLIGLFGVLACVTVATEICGRGCAPESGLNEVKLRVRSWWIIATLFTLAMTAGTSTGLFFLAFVSFLALREFFSLVPIRRVDRRVMFWCYLAIPIQFFWIATDWYGMFTIFIPVYLFLFLPLRMVIGGETKGFLAAASTLHWGLMLTVFSIGHVGYLLMLSPIVNPRAGPAGLVLFLVMLTELNDVFQFCWGKLLGRHKVVPTISPKKTVEGLLGGIFTTCILALALAHKLTPFDPAHALFAGLIVSIGGFVGDVVISAVKRDIGVKDTGTMIPGHGGILDRIDSLTYTAPLFFHFVRYFYAK